MPIHTHTPAQRKRIREQQLLAASVAESAKKKKAKK